MALQAQYSLVARELEREHVPVCEQFGLGILPWSPLAGGFLSGKYRKGQPPPDSSRLAKWKDRLAGFDTPRNWRTLEAVDAVAAELKASPSQVALAWLLRKRAVTSVIFGAHTPLFLDAGTGRCTCRGHRKPAPVRLSSQIIRSLIFPNTA